MSRALVLLSGGLDSAVALWWARHEGLDPLAISFHYPGRPRGEIRATDELVLRAGCEHVEAELPFLKEAADADREGGTRRFSQAPPAYVPGRNAIYYAVACYHAQVLGCDTIVGGHNREDGERYPDASSPFFVSLEAIMAQGLWRGSDVSPPRLRMPLADLGPEAILDLGRALGVPLALTWSCYEDGDLPCGACPACVRRGDVPSDERPLSVVPARRGLRARPSARP